MINNDEAVELSCVSLSCTRPPPFAMVQLNETLRETLEDEVARAEIAEHSKTLLATVNESVAHHEQLAFLAVVSDARHIESGLLTPTMKIERAAIEDHYADRVDGWYEQKSTIVWQ